MSSIQARSRSPARRARLLAAAAALVGVAGCGDGDPAPPLDERATPVAESAERTGSLSFALTARAGVEFDTFSWVVTGPNFSRSGSIDVANSKTVSGLIDGIPVGAGYSITLMGTSVRPARVTCTGSEAFDVSGGAVTSVPVALACRGAG